MQDKQVLNTMRYRKIRLTIVAVIGLLVLNACTGSGASPTAGSTTRSSDPVALAYDPSDGSLLKADRQGLYRWRTGQGWGKVALPQTADLSGVVFDPDHPGTVYISGPGLGVTRSDDGGKSWRSVNTGLPNLEVSALALHSFRRQTLYAWVRKEGIFRTEDGGASWKRAPDQGPPDKDVRGLVHSTLPGSMNTGWLYALTPTGAYLSMDCF